MAQLIVRQVDEQLVRALKVRAAQNNRSAEAEHRELLRQALMPQSRHETFTDYLLAIPAGGAEADFRRNPGRPRRSPLR